MKKTLLSALFCGFVLNNGYCFDEEHKITEEYLSKLFDKPMEAMDDLCKDRNTNNNNERIDELDNQIRCIFEGFVKELLSTIIPSGENEGRTVASLLREHKLDYDTIETICDSSMIRGEMMKILTMGNDIDFLLNGGDLYVTSLWYGEKELYASSYFHNTGHSIGIDTHFEDIE